LDNIGRKNSYVYIKEAWGQTSALPNRLYKGTTAEGGVNTPAFVYYPKQVKHGKSSAIVTVRDILPTLLDVAGTKHPGISYQGRTVLPVQGTSILPFLTGADTTVHSNTTPFGFELFGLSALRKDNWKIVRFYPPRGDGHWQLYNLTVDPAELNDLTLADGTPGQQTYVRSKVQELQRDWRAYVEQNNVIELGYDFGYGWIDDSLIRVH
jgi:arylsulfatase